jgi:hypothetical protein
VWPLEDQQGGIHVLTVAAGEEAQLLLTWVGSSVESMSSRISPRWQTCSLQRRMKLSSSASFRDSRSRPEGSQQEQTGVAGDLATGKVSADGLMTVEGEAQLW